MSCIKTRSHKRGPIADHHREDFFAALVNYGDLVEINNSISRRRSAASISPVRDQFGDAFFGQSTLKGPSLFGTFLFYRDSQHALVSPSSCITEQFAREPCSISQRLSSLS